MADYKKIRHTQIKGEKGTTWYVELWKDGFTGTSTEMTLGGEGFEITWNGQGSTRDRVFLGSECVLSLMVENDTDEDLLYNILDSGFKKYFIRIYKNSTSGSNIWWYGYIQPSFDTIENAPYPYVSRITATDSYGYYEKQLFSSFSSEDEKKDNHNLVRIWLDFLHNMDLAPVNLIHNPYFRGNSNKGWTLQPNDTMTSSGLNISSDTGYRNSNSFLQTELIVGEKYELNIQVNTASGSLLVYDGYPGNLIDTISSTGLKTYTYTQSAAGGNPGLYFRTISGSAFTGQIDWVSLNRTNNVADKEVLAFPSNATNFMWTATDWHTSISTENDATRYYICKGAFATNSNFPFEYKESDALEESLKIFNTVGFLAEGTYNFIQPNHYIDNTTGQNNFYKYNRTTADASPISTTNLCEINQSTNILLGGSSFTYEAPFKSVSTVFTSVGQAFNLPSGTNITDLGSDNDYVYGGQMTANKSYELDWASTYVETVPKNNLPGLGVSQYNSIQQTFNYYITIKATTITGDKYLSLNSSGDLYWGTSQKQIILSRGLMNNSPSSGTYSSIYKESFNESTCEGAIKNAGVKGPAKYMDYKNPDNINLVTQPNGASAWAGISNGTDNFVFRGKLNFKVIIPSLSDTSSVFVKVETKIPYAQYSTGGHGTLYSNVTPLSTTGIIKESTSNGITLEVLEETSLDTNEARFTETSTSSTSTENFDLGDVSIGVTESDVTFAITDINNEAVTDYFYRGSDVAGGEVATQLLVKEFLEMQQSPLQILQGSIQSANISPLDIVKYKLNSDDAAAKYYMFLGGTFKANSEIMEGEWFRIKGD
jgi:hypothetical protein